MTAILGTFTPYRESPAILDPPERRDMGMPHNCPPHSRVGGDPLDNMCPAFCRYHHQLQGPANFGHSRPCPGARDRLERSSIRKLLDPFPDCRFGLSRGPRDYPTLDPSPETGADGRPELIKFISLEEP